MGLCRRSRQQQSITRRLGRGVFQPGLDYSKSGGNIKTAATGRGDPIWGVYSPWYRYVTMFKFLVLHNWQ